MSEPTLIVCRGFESFSQNPIHIVWLSSVHSLRQMTCSGLVLDIALASNQSYACSSSPSATHSTGSFARVPVTPRRRGTGILSMPSMAFRRTKSPVWKAHHLL